MVLSAASLLHLSLLHVARPAKCPNTSLRCSMVAEPVNKNRLDKKLEFRWMLLCCAQIKIVHRSPFMLIIWYLLGNLGTVQCSV